MKIEKSDNKMLFGIKGESKILQSIRGIYITKILRAAVQLELFTLLDKKPLSGEEIRTSLNLHGRGLYDFLDTLVSLGLLNREGNGTNGRYFNTQEVSIFLVKHSSQYIGWSLEHMMGVLEQSWGKLVDALKTGNPQRQGLKDTGKDLFDVAYDNEKKSQTFVEGMNFTQMGSFNDFAEKFNFSRYSVLCDIGGSNALFSILVAEKNTHMKFINFDLPAIEPYARKKIEEAGLTDRIKVVSGDFFEGSLPKADIYTMGNILHDWGIAQKKQLISKSYNALPDGGALVVLESIIDDERRENTKGFLMSLNMLLTTKEGFDFTASDFKSWATKAGFKKIDLLPLDGLSDAIIAYK
jgi:hypothetical protein